MNSIELSEHRVARLLAAIDKLSGGNRTDFARRLGYKDGAFVRQMISGLRPVSEKTVRAIEDFPGMRGWFDVQPIAKLPQPSEPLAPSDLSTRYAAAAPNAQLVVDLLLMRSDEKWPAWAAPPMQSVLTAALEVAAGLQGGRRKSG